MTAQDSTDGSGGIPHADSVVQPGRDVRCRRCEQEISTQEAWVGATGEPPAHVLWECPDCGFSVAELLGETA
jgi:hypothetical protein